MLRGDSSRRAWGRSGSVDCLRPSRIRCGFVQFLAMRQVSSVDGPERSPGIGNRDYSPFSLMRSTHIHRYMRAPRSAVYRLLLDPAAIEKWRVPDGMTAQVHSFEAREGGSFRISLTYVDSRNTGKTTEHTDTYHGRFLRLVPDEQVIEAEEFETSDPAMSGEMISTITLADADDGGTDLVALHEGLPAGVALADNETGWRMALAKLAALAEAGPRPTR